MSNTGRPPNPRASSSFQSFKTEPDVSIYPELASRRHSQWRRFSRDPFMPPLKDEAEPEKPVVPKQEQPASEYPRRVRYPGSGWTHLFYDLAWTATFATLSQNGKFDEPLDLLSYFAFFAAVLWLWASQTLYSVHFYTNDWFHLTSIFLQLFIFGMLAATTNGYDVTTYISRAPGGGSLNPPPPPQGQEPSGEEELEEFAAARTALLSARAMAVAFAATRFLHLLQYVRACIYARWGKGAPARGYTGWGRYVFDYVHPQVFAIVVGLMFSNLIFFAVVGIVFTDFGITVPGASLKLGLWIGGFVLEICSHLWYPIMRRINYFQVEIVGRSVDKRTIQGNNTPKNNTGDANNIVKPSNSLKTREDANSTVGANPLPLAGVNLSERLDTITTIILGEGINGFAATLTSILTAPGVWKVVGTNVVSAAFIIWFIVYIYFEGPTGSNPEGEGLRRLIWMVTYLPFLSSIFLLLIGIKNQFILTSTISTVDKTFNDFLGVLDREQFYDNYMNSDVVLSNNNIKKFLFARGMVWSDEYEKLVSGVNFQNETEWSERVVAWTMRISLNMILKSYETFNGKDGDIPEKVQSRINDYNNSTTPNEDFTKSADPRNMEFYGILTELLHGSLEGARYILIFAAGILICLGVQSIVHSRIRDRYQWGVIISRLLMGSILALLLLLNLGDYQVYYIPENLRGQRARVFNWLDANWILPTIALAYGVEFLVEVALAYFAKQATVQSEDDHKRKTAEENQIKAADSSAATIAVHLGGPLMFDYASRIPRASSPSPVQEDEKGVV